MAKETVCVCTWGDRSSSGRAQLEADELRFRGDFALAVPFETMAGVHADAERLRFALDGVPVELALGPTARRWADAIANPPSVAKKLGIGPGSRILAINNVAQVLGDALAGTAFAAHDADVTLARVEELEELGGLAAYAPLWVLYRKGPASAAGESAVREALRARGLIDVKSVSIDDRYGALKFTRR